MKKDVAKLGLCVGLLFGVAYCLYCVDKVMNLELEPFDNLDEDSDDEES